MELHTPLIVARSFCGGSSSSVVRPKELLAPSHGRLALLPLEAVARCLCGEQELPKGLTEHVGKVLMIMRPVETCVEL